jgi:anti-sigma factor RsiW
MNSSEPLQPLTPHEEKLTAYLDGTLPPEDAAIFERQHPEAPALKVRHGTVAAALRKHSASPPLGNGEFFNHQILRQITPPAPAREKAPAFPLWRLIFAGACCALAVVGIYKSLPTTSESETPAPKYMAQVTRVEAGDRLLTAKLVNAEGLAVVWVDGMDKLSPDYVLQ